MSKKIIIMVNGLMFLAGLFFFIGVGGTALATEVKFTPQVQVPGQPAQIDFTNVTNTRPIAEYIKTFFKYLSGVAGILATVFMMIGGLLWLTAAGSPDKIATAKSFVTSSITGLLLAFGAYILLATINTDLVNLKTREITQIKKAPTSTYTDTSVINGCEQLDKTDCEADAKCIWLGTDCLATASTKANCSFYNTKALCDNVVRCRWNISSLKCEENTSIAEKCGVTRDEYLANSTGLTCCKSSTGDFRYARVSVNRSCLEICGSGWQKYEFISEPNCRSVLGYGP